MRLAIATSPSSESKLADLMSRHANTARQNHGCDPTPISSRLLQAFSIEPRFACRSRLVARRALSDKFGLLRSGTDSSIATKAPERVKKSRRTEITGGYFASDLCIVSISWPCQTTSGAQSTEAEAWNGCTSDLAVRNKVRNLHTAAPMLA